MIQKQFFRVFQFFSPETGPRHEELPPPGEWKSADPPTTTLYHQLFLLFTKSAAHGHCHPAPLCRGPARRSNIFIRRALERIRAIYIHLVKMIYNMKNDLQHETLVKNLLRKESKLPISLKQFFHL